jgi:UDP-N-acetylglucosamine acyltransferase
MAVHTTAIIDKAAEIDPTADVGPYTVIEGPVKVGPNVRIYPHCYITSFTEIAEGCQIHPHCVIGNLPQDFHFKGERSYCRIGPHTVIREHSFVHRATTPEGVTTIGANCNLQASTHVGHDATLDDRVTLITFSAIAGHAHIGAGTIISSFSGAHQFVRVGELVMVGSGSVAMHDIPPFLMVTDRSVCHGINRIGMRRADLPPDDINEVKTLFRKIYRARRPMSVSLQELKGSAATPSGQKFLAFFENPSPRGIARPYNPRRRDADS